MANTDMYKFQVIEGIIKAIDFKSKEEVVDLAKRMKDIAKKNTKYSEAVKKAMFITLLKTKLKMFF